MSKDYILIATDLEPDDITFLRISLKGLNNKINDVQKVHILVGEGNIPQAKINKVKEILKVAVADNILNPEFLERIEVLGGSSAKEKSDTMHTLYNKLFFNVASDPENDSTIIEESRGEIEEAIKNTKGAGGKVTIFGLKPLTNLPYIIEQTNSVLDHTDKLYISGSYNFREVADISDKINTILGGG